MKTTRLIILPVIIFILSGCAAKISYDVNFETLDSSKDGKVALDEFSTLFPQSESEFLDEADADKDGVLYPDEWYEFRVSKGYIKP